MRFDSRISSGRPGHRGSSCLGMPFARWSVVGGVAFAAAMVGVSVGGDPIDPVATEPWIESGDAPGRAGDSGKRASETQGDGERSPEPSEVPAPGDAKGAGGSAPERGSEDARGADSTAAEPDLVVSRREVKLRVTRPFLDLGDAPAAEFAVQLSERGLQAPIRGLAIRVEKADPEQTFLIDSNMQLSRDGKYLEGFAESAAPSRAGELGSLRAIGAGEQAELRVGFRRLVPGTHSGILRFVAKGMEEGDAQKIAVEIQARHSVVWAILALIASVLLSFFATRYLDARRRGVELRRKLAELRPAWLRREPLVLPVVRARTLLRQAEVLASRMRLTGTGEIDSLIEQAARMIALLDEARLIREELERARLDQMVSRRALAELERVMDRIAEGAIDETRVAATRAELDGVKEWLDASRGAVRYWTSLSETIDRLLSAVRPEAFKEPELRSKIEALVKRLEGSQPSGLPQMILREHVYARLKLLWERRNSPELSELADLVHPESDSEAELNELFARADRSAWERVRALGFRIDRPTPTPPTPYEALQPLDFRVSTENDELDATYLFQKGLRFEWLFVLEPEDRTKRPIPLTPMTRVPRIVQYAPASGTFRASVRAHFDGRTVDSDEAWFTIRPSATFRWQRSLESIEAVSLIFAAVFAVAAGISSIYYDNPTFGAVPDYLGLFLVGVGADKAKDLVKLPAS